MDKIQWLKGLWPLALVILLAALFPAQAKLTVQLVLGGVVVAFLVDPLASCMQKHLRRKIAVLLSVAAMAVLVVGMALLLIPPIAVQLSELAALLPRLTSRAEEFLGRLNRELKGMRLPELNPEALDFSALGGGAAMLLSGTASFAGSVAGAFAKLGLSVMLGVYFLLDKDNLLIHTELLIPSPARRVALKMAREVGRALRTYLRGQITIALIVGALAALGLWAAGVRSALALGAIVGVFNIIPYFGPVLGGIPAVLTALGQGLWTALMALIALFVVQQLDGMLISPRVMSGATGMSPSAVLLALAVGGSGWGVAGMLFALPVMLIVRICFRVWASRNEMIEKLQEV